MPTRQRAKSDSHLFLPVSLPPGAVHLPDVFQASRPDLYAACAASVQPTNCFQFKPSHAEYYQGLLAECERYAGLVADSGLGDPILPSKNPGILYTLPTLIGNRTQSHYLHALRLILSLRQDLRLQTTAKAFWKEKAKALDPSPDIVTPSASDLSMAETMEEYQADGLPVQSHESTSTLRQSTYSVRHSIQRPRSFVTSYTSRFSSASDSNESFYTVAEELLESRETSYQQLSPILEDNEDFFTFSSSPLTASLERICEILDSTADSTLVNDHSQFSSSKSISSSADESSGSSDTDFSWEAEDIESPIAPGFPSLLLPEGFSSTRSLAPVPSIQVDEFENLPCSTPPKKNRLQISEMLGKARLASSASIRSLRLQRHS